MIRSFSNPSFYIPSAQTQAAVDGVERESQETRMDVESLRQDLDRVLLITEALWTILKKQNGYSDEDLTAVVNEIDLQDGVMDGKPPKAPPRPCPYCGKMVAAHHTLCIFCGKTVPETLFGR